MVILSPHLQLAAVLTLNCVLRGTVVKDSVFSKYAMMEQTLQYQKGNAVQILVFVKLSYIREI